MNENIDNMDWLNNFPALNALKKEDIFSVPENFFGQQHEQIYSSIYVDELKSKFPVSGFTVPDGYFENMQEQVFSVIKLEEMRPAAEPVINPTFFDEQQGIISARIKIDKFAENGSGFSIPENYFKVLTDRINEKTGIKKAYKPAKIRNLFTKTAWKYATAACIAVAVATGFAIKQYGSAQNIQTQLSNLPDGDIENYLKFHSDSYESHIILENSVNDIGLDEINNTKAAEDSNATNANQL